MKKNIIILTKSIKHGGFCVAGIDTDNGEWIRLISSDANSEHAVPYQDMEMIFSENSWNRRLWKSGLMHQAYRKMMTYIQR